MKLILAVIQPTKLESLLSALRSVEVDRFTVCDAQGFARQKGQTETYRGVEYKTQLLRKISVEIVVNDDFVDRTIQTILDVARTGAEGNIGDGKVFVLSVDEAIQIDNGVRGKEAV